MYLDFFALAFFVPFAVPPSFSASSSSPADKSFVFFAFLAVGLTVFSSAFNGPRFQIFEAVGAKTVVMSLTRRLGGIACERGGMAVLVVVISGWGVGGKWEEVMWQWIAADVRIWEDAGLRTDNSYYEFR